MAKKNQPAENGLVLDNLSEELDQAPEVETAEEKALEEVTSEEEATEDELPEEENKYPGVGTRAYRQ